MFLQNTIKIIFGYNIRNINTRFCHTTNNKIINDIRVRFAPSPTGYLHLGGLRTALYNYLFAKKYNGKFLLRIEDTDQIRLVEGATEQLCKDLEWSGIVPDEGPGKYGGNYGPYIQSERLSIYRNEVKKLLDSGHAYYCFCSERRLEILKKEALRTRQIPKYDNRCKHLTPGQIAEKLANQDTFCIRFKLDSNLNNFNDLIYGDIYYDVTQSEGDPVIIKSDGYPTYHFANVVDDHLMKITHVLRGVEWQISTTKHLMMYNAFGWTPPEYGHLPLVTNPDGSKLSKRQNDIQIDNYRKKGIYPQALLNYITLSGGGFNRDTIKPQNDTIEKLSEKFDLNRINEHSSRLNPILLEECNRIEILNQINDPKKLDKLINDVRDLIKKTYPNDLSLLDLNTEHIRNVLVWSGPRLTSLNQLVEGKLSFVWILPKIQKPNEPNLTPEIIESLIIDLKNGNFTKIDLQTLLKKFSNKNNLSFGNFMKSLRNSLSGLNDGPGVAEMMEILGKDKTIQRIRIKK